MKLRYFYKTKRSEWPAKITMEITSYLRQSKIGQIPGLREVASKARHLMHVRVREGSLFCFGTYE